MVMWHLHLVLEKIRGGEVSWDMSLPVSIHRCWLSFVSQVVIGFGGRSVSFVGSRLHLWVVIFIFWLVVVMGRSWVVIGIRCHVVVAVGGVVGLCSWLVEERSDVTGCDISVMFKLTHEISVMFKLAHEITCTISHDFLTVYSQNLSVLVQPQQR